MSCLVPRGGGVAILYKQCFKLKAKSPTPKVYKSFEAADYSINYLSRVVRLVLIYRPPSSSRNRFNLNLVFDEFGCFLELLVTTPGPLAILGDLKFHVDKANDSAASLFLNLLETFDLQQHINVVTYRNGHTLDLIITRRHEDLLSNFNVTDPVISDHLAVHCGISLTKPRFTSKEIRYRKVKSTFVDRFRSDITNLPLMDYNKIDVTELSELYENSLFVRAPCTA